MNDSTTADDSAAIPWFRQTRSLFYSSLMDSRLQLLEMLYVWISSNCIISFVLHLERVMVYLDGRHHSFQQKTFLREGKAVTPEYDFIVVGGGPSGCALATRLSHMNACVLLVEQGMPSVDVLLLYPYWPCNDSTFTLRVERYPELQNSVALPLQTRSLHGSSFDAAYSVSSNDQFGKNKVTLNSGMYMKIL